MRRRGSLRDKRQLEVVDDAVHRGIVGEEGDDLHRAAALGADHRVNLIDFADHLGPALGRDRAELLLHDQERDSGLTCLLDLPPMRISVEAEVTDGVVQRWPSMRSEGKASEKSISFSSYLPKTPFPSIPYTNRKKWLRTG